MAKNEATSFGRVSVDPEKMSQAILSQRRRLGLSQRALAEKAGVAPTTVHNLERGSSGVQLDKFLAILAALDLLPDQVLEIDKGTEPLSVTTAERELAEILKLTRPEEILSRLAALLESYRKA